jgi:phage gp46-like protein
MPDIRLVDLNIPSPVRVTFDWLQRPDGMLDETQELASAMGVALATDALADIDETLPDPDSDDRRGWWGDLDADVIWNGWPIGSKLWLLERAKIVDENALEGATLGRAWRYISDAVRPFLDAQIASRYEVVVERTGLETISAVVTLYRGPLAAIQLRFQSLWNEGS